MTPRPPFEPQAMKSPICCRDHHCGATAIIESVRETETAVTIEVRCARCGDRGCVSTRKDGAR